MVALTVLHAVNAQQQAPSALIAGNGRVTMTTAAYLP